MNRMKWYDILVCIPQCMCTVYGVCTYLIIDFKHNCVMHNGFISYITENYSYGPRCYPHIFCHSLPTPPVERTQDTFGDGNTRSLDSIGPICYLWSGDYTITRTPLFPLPGSQSRLSLRRYYARPNQTAKPAADHYLSHAYVSHVTSGLE
jgi:hypothetical protein